MKYHSLFTPIEQFDIKPQEGDSFEAIIVSRWDTQPNYVDRVYWMYERWNIDLGEQGYEETEITHILDLSKLTNKKIAGQKIMDAFTISNTSNTDEAKLNFINALIQSL